MLRLINRLRSSTHQTLLPSKHNHTLFGIILMEDENLMPDSESPLVKYFRRAYNHFMHGNAPSTPSAPQFDPFLRYFNFTFESHPGPIDDALTDAKNLHVSLFVFIYSKDNDHIPECLDVFKSEAISEAIRRSFIFYPIDITAPDGWKTAISLNFTKLPLFALIRPTGDTVETSQLFITHEGSIDESTLLQILSAESTHDLITQQDNEYFEALRAANLPPQEEEEPADAPVDAPTSTQEEVTAAYNAIPSPQNGEDVVVIRFYFPDSTTRVCKFVSTSEARHLYSFANYYMYPQPFRLLTGFPHVEITEFSVPIKDISDAKQFLVHIEALTDL